MQSLEKKKLFTGGLEVKTKVEDTVKKNITNEADQPIAKSPIKSTRRILVIEDEKPLANALKIKLSTFGYVVELASDGREGLDKILDDKSNYDLVLLDLIMPKLNGFDLLNLLKKEKKAPAVIIISNLSQAGDVEKAKSLGAVDYFVKSDTPITVLAQYVKTFLSK